MQQLLFSKTLKRLRIFLKKWLFWDKHDKEMQSCKYPSEIEQYIRNYRGFLQRRN